MRKQLDHWQLEIQLWNKGNEVFYISCDCGKNAKIIKKNLFICDSCKRKYMGVLGEYIELTEKENINCN